jgi:hypothetical protein
VRALVLDGPGALGRAITDELSEMGVTAVLAGRDPSRYEQTLNLRGDLTDLYRAAGQAAVVVNASGVEDPRLAERSAAASAAFVEVGNGTGYLSELAGLPAKAPILAGARLIPVLAGMLARDAVTHSESAVGVADPVEVGVVLGAGDPESAIDTGSTYRLFGSYFTDPATGEEVLNFSGRRTIRLPDGSNRSLARVNFPDQQMLTAGLGRPVRTYFATGDRFSTALLQGLSRVRGAARLPSAFHLPGSDAWQVFARAGQGENAVLSWAAGRRQIRYTGHLAALAARRAPTLEPGLHRIQDLLTLSDLNDLDDLGDPEGLTIDRFLGAAALGVPQG